MNASWKASAALAAVVLAACSRASVLDTPSGDPYVRGPVESFTHHATASALRVKAGPGSREPCGIVATVDARTRYQQRTASGDLQATSRAALAVGDTVEVYVQGAVALSCPVQAYASVVVRAARP